MTDTHDDRPRRPRQEDTEATVVLGPGGATVDGSQSRHWSAGTAPALPDEAVDVTVEVTEDGTGQATAEAPATPSRTSAPTGPSLGRASAIMAAGTLVSRVLGLVRQMLLTAVLGNWLAGDAFTAANNLPNILFMLLSAGVLNAVLIPQITKAMKRGDGGQEFIDRLLTVAFAMILALAVAATAAAPWLMDTTTSLSGASLRLATLFAFLLLPEILFYGIYALLGNVLNARNQFAAFMWAPALANVVQIVGLVVFYLQWRQQADPGHWTPAMVWTLGGSMTLGIVVQALVLAIPLWRSGFRYRPRWGLRGSGMGEVSRMVGWTFSGLVIAQLGGLLNTWVMTDVVDRHAEAHVAGTTVHANALTLFFLPHSLITVSILTALFPQMSRTWQDGDVRGMRRLVARGLSTSAVGVIPASAALVAMAEPLVRVMMPGFSARGAHDAAVALQIMALGTLAFGISTLQQRYSFAREQGRENFCYQVLLSAVQVVFAGVALWLAPPQWAVATIAAGLVVSNTVVSVAFLAITRRQLGGLGFAPVLRLWTRLLIASVLAAGTAWLVVYGMAPYGRGFALAAVTCALAGTAFALVFLAIARILHIREVDDMLAPVLRRLRMA